MEQYRAKIKSLKPVDYVDTSTKAIRLSYIRQFLNWRINIEILGSNSSKRLKLNVMKTLIDEELRNRTPAVLHRDTINNRTGISRDARRILLDTIDPANSRNPWLTNFTRYRNQLIIHMLIAIGTRRSEMLGIRISDIQPRLQEILIHRRPDDAYDPRIHEPNTKTQARALPISPDLYSKIKSYLILRHNVVRGRHDFLIAANNGNPISKSETNRIFRDLDFVSELAGLMPQVLRHTYCENLAEDLHKSGHSSTEMIVFLRRLGGWSDSSDTPHRYISRFINDAAATASRTPQEKLLIN